MMDINMSSGVGSCFSCNAVNDKHFSEILYCSIFSDTAGMNFQKAFTKNFYIAYNAVTGDKS